MVPIARQEEESNKPELVKDRGDEQRGSLDLSPYTKALIKSWVSVPAKQSVPSNRVSVSQSVSFLAFLYEKMRNAVEFREENLIRRAAIARIIKRRMVLNENGRDIAELLIKELLWARYYENNTLGEEKIKYVQSSIDKYFFLRNEMSAGRSGQDQEKIANFIIEVLSCEIEEILSPNPKREAFNNYVYQLIRTHIAPFDHDALEKDTQVYIAVQRSFAHSDDALIRYNLLKLMLPEITNISWKSADQVLPKFYDVYKEIEKSLVHPLADKTRNYVNKLAPPFYILLDIYKNYSSKIESLLKDETLLKNKVDEACRERYEETKARLRRTGIRSFIYIILTKFIFAFVLEIPYDLYFTKSISYIPITINLLFPPILMSVIILSVTVPGDENTRKIFQMIKDIITENPNDPDIIASAITIGRAARVKSPIFQASFTVLYLLTYLISFGSIIYVLTKMNFNIVSQGIFIFFVTLVTFFAFKVIGITREYLVVDKEGPFSPFMDFFFLPIIRVGQWLSGEVLTKFNLFIFIFDFIIEMPLKAIIEVIDEWAHFVRLKKEEMV